jgi:uncharacterized protein
MHFDFEPWQWGLLALGAMLVGVSKSGIPGLGILTVAIFSNLLPARASTGVVLPLLIVGDIVAAATYLRHTRWSHVARLFPWTIGGVVAGYFALRLIDDRTAAVLIGAILLGMLGLHVWRSRRAAAERLEHEVEAHAAWFAPLSGVLAGFTTLVANAAGPVLVLYLLAMRLPKLEFLGTGAAFFMALNLFKVPFMTQLGLINRESLALNLVLAPLVIAGSFLGRAVAGRISQQLFQRVALVLTFAAAVRLLWPR